jgi:hypothetical protein
MSLVALPDLIVLRTDYALYHPRLPLLVDTNLLLLLFSLPSFRLVSGVQVPEHFHRR